MWVYIREIVGLGILLVVGHYWLGAFIIGYAIFRVPGYAGTRICGVLENAARDPKFFELGHRVADSFYFLKINCSTWSHYASCKSAILLHYYFQVTVSSIFMHHVHWCKVKPTACLQSQKFSTWSDVLDCCGNVVP